MADMLDSRIGYSRYDLEAMNRSEVKRFDPCQRQAEKQASRDADARALRSGKRSAAQVRRENGLLAFPREALSVDFAGFVDRAR